MSLSPVYLEHFEGDSDIDSFMDRFGHGECHALTAYLAITYGLPIQQVLTQETGIAVHSFVLMGGLALDAFGLTHRDDAVNRFESLAQYNFSESVVVKPCSYYRFLWEMDLDPRDIEDAGAEFHNIIGYLDLSEDQLKSYGKRPFQNA